MGHTLVSAALAVVGAIGLSLLAFGAGASELPDTGQPLCDDGLGNKVACSLTNTGDESSTPRQDGRYGRDGLAAAGTLVKTGGGSAGLDYTALDTSGNPTAPSSGGTPHPCVRDNVSGLVWEVKTMGTDGWHDGDWAMVWYSSNSSTNGGDTGHGPDTGCKNKIPGGCDTEMMIAAVNAAGWCGFHDWRLPSYRELLTLINAGTSQPTIDAAYFPNTLTAYYWWTADTDPVSSNKAYSVTFLDGSANTAGKRTGNFVRLVRGSRF